jgi:hypothetical protein
MSSIPSQANFGAYIPTTYNFDVQQLYSVDINSQEFKELLVRLAQNVNTMLLGINLRDAGYYSQEEFINGQTFFPNPNLNSTTSQQPIDRQVFRKVINFGALPNAAIKSVAHGITITSAFSFTRIYACASDQSGSSYIPIPYVSTVAVNQNIELYVDATNVNIATAIDYTAYTICYVILEYIKQ